MNEACKEDEFQCVAADYCIPDKWQCDSHNDCPDGSDGMNYNHSTQTENENTTCEYPMLLCDDGSCVSEAWDCGEFVFVPYSIMFLLLFQTFTSNQFKSVNCPQFFKNKIFTDGEADCDLEAGEAN